MHSSTIAPLLSSFTEHAVTSPPLADIGPNFFISIPAAKFDVCGFVLTRDNVGRFGNLKVDHVT